MYMLLTTTKNAVDCMEHMNIMMAFSSLTYGMLNSMLVSTAQFALPVIGCSGLYDRRLGTPLLQLPSFQPLGHLRPGSRATYIHGGNHSTPVA